MAPKCFALSLLLAGVLRADPGAVPGLNQFAVASYHELAHGSGNLIYSPFNIAASLSMALAGARGETATEMAKVLGQVYPDSAYDASLNSLVEQLAKAANTGGNELSTANGLWMQRGFPVLSDFRRIIQDTYRAPLMPVDFAANAEQAREQINSWTSQHTRNRIRELFGPGSLDGQTRLALTSAIYFYGKWQSAFPPASTRPEPFKLEGGGTAQASFMNQASTFGYGETPALQILEMRYGGIPLAFDVLLPKQTNGLADLERSLSAENLATWLGSLQDRTVVTAIPKFRAESEFSLRDTLSKMGMPAAFSDSADFSGIDDRRDLCISAVVHKAFVDVSETGTEAAAATGTAMRLIAMASPPRETVFRADHPFVFVIRDTRSGVILFAGRLVKP